MGRSGGRAPAEWIEGIPRQKLAVPPRFEPTEPERATHIDLRVLRRASVDDGRISHTIPHEAEWDTFLKKLGRANHQFGAARSLGSVAITILPSHRLNNVLRESRPKEYFHPKKKLDMFRRTASHMTDFIRESAQEASDIKIQRFMAERQIATTEARRRFESDDDMTDTDWHYLDAADTGLTPEEFGQMSEYSFGATSLAVQGLAFYGRRYGLDLASNEQLFEERSGLLGFLRSDLKLNTSSLSQNWDAHGSVFDLHDHVGRPAFSYDPSAMPTTMMYDKPIVEQHVVPLGI